MNEELTIIQPDGKAFDRLPANAKHIFNFRVSPDGKRIAYTAVVQGKFKAYVTDMFSETSLISRVARLAGQDIPEGDPLDGEADFCLWSPDGKKLACNERLLVVDPIVGETATGHWATRHWIVDLKTKEKSELHLPEGHWLQDWSKDGNRFLSVKFDKRSEEKTESHVSLVKKDGTEVRRLSNAKQWAWDARFSPDGKRALYTANECPGRVFVVDLPEGKPKPVSPELNAVIYDACWSPDGKRIAYVWHQQRVNSDQDNLVEFVLSVIDPDGKNPVTLRTEKGREGPPAHVDWR